jgi:hypothetical protein
LARREEPFVRQTDDDAGTPDATGLDDASVPDAPPDALDIAPHALLGIDPPHGPFVGGTLVMIRGNGFESNARVWFGDVEAPRASVTPVDPQRIQVITPPGTTGAVELRVQNGDAESTRAALTGGYTYDGFFASPSSGPTSGGTLITIEGEDTQWDEDTTVEIDRKPCSDLSVLSPTKLVCATPPADAGAKVLSVISGDEREDVLDGFSYGNSDDGFRGGLSGQALSDQLTVLAFDNLEGHALPGVAVLLGDDVDSGEVKYTDRNGAATFSGKLGPKRNVTLALKCFQPITFYDVPVDHVTAYLDPVMSPACADWSGQLPPGGGTPGVGSSIAGEVVWPPDKELRRQGWSNVPPPASESEREVAYVFRLSDRPDVAFSLPASGAVTRDAQGALGYKFYKTTSPGNFTLYALAGLEDSSKTPRVFTAYAMGLLRGVAVKPGQSSQDVYIAIDVPLDHALSLTLDPPTPGPRGPDRIRASVAVEVEDSGFAILPGGSTSHALPGATDFAFVGVPPLVGTLAGSHYVLTASAVTGAGETSPLSVIGSFSATTTGKPLDLGGFVPLPVLTAPAKDTKWDMSSLSLEQAQEGQSVDLTVVRVRGGAGLYEWTLAAPGRRDKLELPNLGALAPDAALPGGSLQIETTLAHIEDFDYGSLRYRQLTPRGWNAYATDTHLTQH